LTLPKEARYVIRLANDRSYMPSDQSRLLQSVRECVRPLGGQSMNLRVSRQALEFDLFIPEKQDLQPILFALQRVAPVLNWKRLDLPPGPIEPEKVIAEARSLFNEERFWEAHEILEGLWKLTQGQEKQMLQGMILTAAALVHVQKNEPKVVIKMLQDAARRLENQPPEYYGLHVHDFLNHVKHLIAQPTTHFPSI
jgi:hypothetical protein